MGILLALMPVPAAMMLHGDHAARLQRLARAAVAHTRSTGASSAATLYGAFVGARRLRGAAARGEQAGRADRHGPHAVRRRWRCPRSCTSTSSAAATPFACGAICTALSLTAGVSGPILDVFFVRSKMSRHARGRHQGDDAELQPPPQDRLLRRRSSAVERRRGRAVDRRDDGGCSPSPAPRSRAPVLERMNDAVVPPVDALDGDRDRRLLPRQRRLPCC